MAVVKRISPGSAFKVGLIVYAFIGLIVGIPFALIGMLAGSLVASRAPIPGAGMGIFAVLFFPILYGLIGGIFGAISAALYNLAAGWVGGLEVEIN
jgi:hypothetical protein